MVEDKHEEDAEKQGYQIKNIKSQNPPKSKTFAGQATYP